MLTAFILVTLCSILSLVLLTMKVTQEEMRVRVMDEGWTPEAVARQITQGGAQEEPFFVMDVGEVVARLRRWRELMPRVEPFYAVKCNNDKLLVRTLAALGTGFDCASRAEIELVTGNGVAPERIIFAHTAKLPSHLQFASLTGVHTVTFDSGEELLKIKQIMPHAQLVLRIRCDAAVARVPLGSKFGCNPTVEGPRLLELAAALGMNVVGVSFHVGSDASEPDAYARGVQLCGTLFARGAALGLRLRLLDIGGGFPGELHEDIQEVSAVINSALETHFPDRGVRVIAEPGRYFAAAAYTLAACVFAKRAIAAADGEEAHTMYFLNDGVFGTFMDFLLDKRFPHPLLLHPSVEKTEPCSVWGPTCDATDCLLPSARLPPLPLGSWLLFRDRGAYSSAFASAFNGFPLPRIYGFVDRKLWSVLKDLSPFTEAHFQLTDAEPQSRHTEEINS